MPATVEEPAQSGPPNLDECRVLLALYGDEFIDLWDDTDNLGEFPSSPD